MSDRTSFDEYLDEQLEDEEFRREFELARAQIDAIDQIVRLIDAARVSLGMSKADLARAMRVKPAAVRRLLSEQSPNPTLMTVAKAAHAVGLEVTVAPAERAPTQHDPETVSA